MEASSPTTTSPSAASAGAPASTAPAGTAPAGTAPAGTAPASAAPAAAANGSQQRPGRPSSPPQTAPQGQEVGAERTPRQFVTFSLYKLDPAWRRLEAQERARGREEWIAAVREAQASGTVVVPYSCVGLRSDHDILLWRIDYKLERLQQMSAAMSATGLGAYLLPSRSFLSMSKRSVYVDKINPEHEELRSRIVPGRGKYIFVYPFVKNRDWYLLHRQTRQGIMDEHIQIGNKYPSVKLNTTYSFGIDDQEFVVAFESDHPEDFVDLVMDLRETDSSRYTLRDTPIISGVKGTLEEILTTLGG